MKIIVTEQQFIKNLGNKIKTGVNNLIKKVSGQSQPETPAPAPSKGRDPNQVKTEWSKINSDMSNKKGFGDSISQDISTAQQQGESKARAAILKKLGTTSSSFGTKVVDSALFKLNDGTYNYLCVLEMTS